MAQTAAPGPPAFQMMEIERIQPSPLNPRKVFDKAKLEELAATMANGVGVIEPLVVRPVPARNCYELVAGERRWRAAAHAGLVQVPVMVRELSDAQVLEIMVIENNQREDITALEEARGFRQLLTLGKLTPDALAERLGRSKKYVYDRVKLLDLVGPGQQLLERGLMTAGHAILLARLKPEHQKRALDPFDGGVFEDEHARLEPDAPYRGSSRAMRAARTKEGLDEYAGFKARSVRELEDWIAHHVRFDVAHMAKAAPLEFGAVGQAVATAAAKPGRGKKVVPISFDYHSPDGTKDPNERAYGRPSWKAADGREGAKACEHSVLGVVAGGPGYGQAFEVCIARDKCLVHWKTEVTARKAREKARAKAAAGGKATDDRAKAKAREEAEQRKRKEQQQQEEALRKLWKASIPQLLGACADKVAALAADRLLAIVLDLGRYDGVSKREYDEAITLLRLKAPDAVGILRGLALANIIRGAADSWSRDQFAADAKKHLGIDVTALLKRVQSSAQPAPAGKSKKKAKAA